MFVCNCKGVTDQDIRDAAHHQGVNTLKQLRMCTGATGQCGKCAVHARQVLDEARAEVTFFDPAAAVCA